MIFLKMVKILLIIYKKNDDKTSNISNNVQENYVLYEYTQKNYTSVAKKKSGDTLEILG